MYFTSILTATLSVLSLATALPQATTTNTSPPPPGETYITGYPLCGVPGYTQTPGPYVETIYQESNSTLSSCAAACRKAYPSCQSFAFQANYTECLFYTACVQETQLWNDGSSLFVHYDLSCNV